MYKLLTNFTSLVKLKRDLLLWTERKPSREQASATRTIWKKLAYNHIYGTIHGLQNDPK